MSLVDFHSTIVAIASPTSPAIRGIVRLAGDDVAAVIGRLLGRSQARVPLPTRAARFEIAVETGSPLGLVPVSLLWWPDHRSYTGQPSAELHTIGSLPMLRALVDAVIDCGARAASPGEFTMRAFLAGRMDLTQAEAVLGVIEAETRGSLDHALRQLAGNLSAPLEQMRSDVLDLLADVEAGLDFVDEDIEFIQDAVLLQRLREMQRQLESTWQTMQRRGGGTSRSVVALRGEPNAGKSCLMNCLSGRNASIVANVPGTTRDVVTVEAMIGGRTVLLVDTAGIDASQSELDQLAQQHARRAAEQACVRLWCVDLSRSDFVQAVDRMRAIAAQETRPRTIDLWVATKQDCGETVLTLQSRPWESWHLCSAVTRQGIGELNQAIEHALAQRDAEEIGSVHGTASRCSDSLRRAQVAIGAAIELTQSSRGHEFVAAELRTVAQCLGEVTGAVYTDDILDRVFGRFCIGK
jgi:tRNA modification GTPase